jgi:aminocarboxymuconate-semialdehyde decarboxylase
MACSCIRGTCWGGPHGQVLDALAGGHARGDHLAITSMIFSGLFERLPRLRVAFAHGGGSFPATVGAHRAWLRSCVPTSARWTTRWPRRIYLGRFWIDSLVHDPVILQYLVDLVGADKVALGTDYPFPLGELEPGSLIRGMAWPDARKEMLLSGAALGWLGMQRQQFLP